MKAGDKYSSNKWGPVTIIERVNTGNVLIEFDNTGNQRWMPVSQIVNGSMADIQERERLKLEAAERKKQKKVFIVDSKEHGVFEANHYQEIADKVGCSLFTIYHFMKGNTSSFFNSITTK